MKIFQKVVRAGAVSISLCVGVFSQVPPTSFIILNEIEVNNPGTDDPACEFIELRGDANTSVPGEIYLLEVEGDGTSAGTVDFARNINGQQLGPNGTVTFGGTSIVGAGDRGIPASVCGSRSYTDSGGIHVEDPNLTLENGTISFMLVAVEKSVIGVGDDIDTNDDGIIDNLPFDAMIIDAVGWSDGGVADFVYGGVNVTPGNTSGSPDGATRNFTNITELDPAAWFADDLASPGSVEAVLYDQNNLGGFRIDFLTPARQNLAPTAAAGTIAGTVTDSKGRGLKFVSIVLAGGDLQEPIYATTNHFGRYNFPGLPVGRSYVLRVISRRYTFSDPVRIVNLDGIIARIDFIGGLKQYSIKAATRAGKFRMRDRPD